MTTASGRTSSIARWASGISSLGVLLVQRHDPPHRGRPASAPASRRTRSPRCADRPARHGSPSAVRRLDIVGSGPHVDLVTTIRELDEHADRRVDVTRRRRCVGQDSRHHGAPFDSVTMSVTICSAALRPSPISRRSSFHTNRSVATTSAYESPLARRARACRRAPARTCARPSDGANAGRRPPSHGRPGCAPPGSGAEAPRRRRGRRSRRARAPPSGRRRRARCLAACPRGPSSVSHAAVNNASFVPKCAWSVWAGHARISRHLRKAHIVERAARRSGATRTSSSRTRVAAVASARATMR